MTLFSILLVLCFLGALAFLVGLGCGFPNFVEPFWIRVAAIGFVVFAVCGAGLAVAP